MKTQTQNSKLVTPAASTATGVKLKISNEISWIVREVYDFLAKYDPEQAKRYLDSHLRR